MKVLVTGANGQLGYDLTERLQACGHDVTACDLQESSVIDGVKYIRLDITERDDVFSVMREERPDAVMHCAAWTAVDAAEDNEETVFRINAEGTKHIAEAAAETGAVLFYMSTDYVFDGRGEEPWKPEDVTDTPLNVYGRSKLQGEKEITARLEKYFIVRISWVFGNHGRNFVRTMLELGKTHDTLRVVDDQTGTPTYTYDLAVLLEQMLKSDRYGIYHVTNSEEEPGAYISWADFAEEIFTRAGYPVTIQRVTTAEYGLSKAARPFNSRMDKSKLTDNGFSPLPSWRHALEEYLRKR